MTSGLRAWKPEIVHFRIPSNGNVGPEALTTTFSEVP